MRLFVAVTFESHVCDAIQTAITNFPIVNPPWRWAKRVAWHLTLKFIGETPDADVPVICSALADAARKHTPFEIVIGGLGGFPNLTQPRVLFYRVGEGRDRIAALAGDVDDALALRAGIERERRPFRAHVTVARIKDKLEASIVAKLSDAPPVSKAKQDVSVITLIRSQLSPQGARYEQLKQFALPTGP